MSLAHRITQDLGRAIVGGAYLPGAVLGEGAIAAREGAGQGAGRGAVREAVKMLEAKGLIEARPRRGTAVLPVHRWNLYDRDVQAWMRAGRPSPALLGELLETRRAFEPAAARLAAARATDQQLVSIRTAHRRMAEAEAGRDDPSDADLAFHAAVLRTSGNRFFAALVPLIDTALRHSIQVTNAARGDAVGDLAAHTRVLDAVAARDAPGAEAAMRALLDDVAHALGWAAEEPGEAQDYTRRTST